MAEQITKDQALSFLSSVGRNMRAGLPEEVAKQFRAVRDYINTAAQESAKPMRRSPLQQGGPAFPVDDIQSAGPGTTDELKQFARGMSLRDYYIAHAPAEPQPWFLPVMPPKPNKAPYVSNDGQRFYATRFAAEKSEREKFRSENEAEIRAWDAENLKQRYVQWPAAWADEMLKAREAA